LGEFQQQIGNISMAFGEISSRAVAESNARRLEIAQGNITAAQNQIDLEETTQRNAIARELAKFQGAQAAARAFRGGGSAGSGDAIADAANAQAADQVAIVEANAANKSIANIAANQVQLDDPVLAFIQGATEGIGVGTQIANMLLEEAQVFTHTVIGAQGQMAQSQTIQLPEFNLSEIFGNLFGD